MNTELTAKQIARIERIRAERAERIVQCESCAPEEEIDMCKGCQHPIDEEGMCFPGCDYYLYEGSWKCKGCETWRDGEKHCAICGPRCEYCHFTLPEYKMHFEYKMEDDDTFLCCGKCADDDENDLSDVSLVAVWKFGTSIEVEDPEEFDISDYKDYMFRDQDDEESVDNRKCICGDTPCVEPTNPNDSPLCWSCDKHRHDDEYEPGEKEFIQAVKNEDFEEMVRLFNLKKNKLI